MNYLSIGSLSKLSGSTVTSLRYYEQLGLIHSKARHSGQVRYFSADTAPRLKAISYLQELGFTLREILALLRLSGGKRQQCLRLNRRLSEKLLQIEKEFKRLAHLRERLKTAIRQCKIKDGVCQGELARLLGYAGPAKG